MTLAQFENGYWYLDEIKNFAKEIGVRLVSRLRKDELWCLDILFRMEHFAVPVKNNAVSDL